MTGDQASPALRQWEAAGERVMLGAHRQFVRDSRTGHADVVLLLHGFPTASFDWHLLWDTLTSRWRVIAPDLLGFGFSDKPAEHSYSVLDQADRIEALLKARGVAAVHVLAHDLGDSVAQELLSRDLARRRTGTAGLRLRGIVFLNGGLFPEAHRPRPIQRLLAGPIGPLLVRLMNQARFERSFAAVFGARSQPDSRTLSDCWTLVTRNDGLRLAPQLLGYMAERRLHRDRWLTAMQAGDVPLRLIAGLADPVSGASLVARYRALLPNSEVIELPGIGHYPQLEAPEAVLRSL